MTVLRYRPASRGGWLVVAEGFRALIVGPSGWVLADDAAEVIGGERGFEAAVDLITRAGFGSIPDFVLLEWTGGRVRSLLRGAVTLAVTDRAGEHTQDGSGISTWTERSFTEATAVRVTVHGAVEGEAVDALPLRSGAALLVDAELDFSDLASHRPDATPVGAAATSSPSPAAPAPPAPAPPVDEATVSSIPDQIREETSTPPTETLIETATHVAGTGSVGDETIVRSQVEPAPADTIAPPPAASDDRAGDHDGNTILSSDIARLRSGRESKAAVHAPPAVNPPAVYLKLPDGSREQLGQLALIGRSPSVSQVSGDRMPRLITVGGGDQDISRNHAQIAVEGGTVVVTDLHSRNGTTVVLPGKSPQKLRAGEPTSVIAGTVVDLGGGITLTVGEE